MGESALIVSATAPPTLRPISEFVNRVITGDCVKVMALMPNACIDFALTDPPYAARYRDRSQRTVSGDDTTSWLNPAFLHIARVMKNNRASQPNPIWCCRMF